MSFTLTPTETQTMLRDATDRLVKREGPLAKREAVGSSGIGHSPRMWQLLADSGLLSIELDERHGGSAGSFADLAVILESLGRGWVAEPLVPTVVLAAHLLSAMASDDIRQALLPKVAAGTLKLALAHDESGPRYAPHSVRTTAVRSGTGFVLKGNKAVVVGGSVADHVLVSARTSGGDQDLDGISLFLVERHAPGLRVLGYATLGGVDAADLTLDRVQVSESALIGAEGRAGPRVDHALDRAVVALCCEAIGIMDALNELTLAHLKTRRQFGRAIGAFQVLQHRMADMAMACELARSVSLLAVQAIDSGDRHHSACMASAAKVRVGEAARCVGRGAIQLHGGMGMTLECSVGHFFRRLVEIEILFGSIEQHLIRFSELSRESQALETAT